MRGRWRSAAAGLLIALGCLLTVPAVAAVWLDSTVVDTEGYVDTVGPLAADPAVQDAVAARLADRVEAAVGRSGPLTDRLRERIEEQVRGVIASDRFATAWTEANRIAHRNVVAVLTGDDGDGVVTLIGDTVTLQLGAIAAPLQERLAAAGVPLPERLTAADTQVALLQSDHLPAAREWLARIDRLGRWLPVAAVVLLAAGVLLARNRPRASAVAGGGVGLAMLALVAGLALARPPYLDALPPTVDPDAAAVVFDQLVSPLRSSALVVLAAGLVICLAAAVATRLTKRRARVR
ncbi:hypothetical protein [Jiangella sp. DSM 45060]|uniref:hypothetical protein n=1 Tax=Jiangella sp. DSM 45060 TaxID=1798224 RepID=UPI00087BA065|nr:hypothetical protein [Jiangella sp. DSM 45060]SDT14536.1 hypothetical protein SAMN04515669_2911 [Jiangella sp. DSM 45060]